MTSSTAEIINHIICTRYILVQYTASNTTDAQKAYNYHRESTLSTYQSSQFTQRRVQCYARHRKQD